jgi:hypothetical protein
VADVPLHKAAEFRDACRKAAAWYGNHKGSVEHESPTWILLDPSGEIISTRGEPPYIAEQARRRWRLARIDHDTDAASCDAKPLEDAWGSLDASILEIHSALAEQ